MAACFSADIVIHLSTTMAMLPAIDFVLNVMGTTRNERHFL